MSFGSTRSEVDGRGEMLVGSVEAASLDIRVAEIDMGEGVALRHREGLLEERDAVLPDFRSCALAAKATRTGRR